jgi:predicted DNA binding CopG/RHH family protein
MRHYVKSESRYARVSFEAKKIRAAIKKGRGPRKQPTSVALDPEFIDQLKDEAQARGVPYQVLMRMFIVEGFRRFRRGQ